LVTAAGPLLVFSLYLLFAGHNQPGGGFAGGLVAGVVLVLAWSAGGVETVRRILPVRSSAVMGAGLVIASLTGFASLLVDLSFLESGYLELDLPLIGPVKAVSALVFDVGVYLVVVGMALRLVRSLGEDNSEGAS
jgi:multicomponent Na+:H+ antiporter subunit A